MKKFNELLKNMLQFCSFYISKEVECFYRLRLNCVLWQLQGPKELRVNCTGISRKQQILYSKLTPLSTRILRSETLAHLSMSPCINWRILSTFSQAIIILI